LDVAHRHLISAAYCRRSGTEDEVKALFAKFVAAQNAHDLKSVGELLQDSPQFLLVSRGVPFWGRDAALKRCIRALGLSTPR
jgi:hypothetical protein